MGTGLRDSGSSSLTSVSLTGMPTDPIFLTPSRGRARMIGVVSVMPQTSISLPFPTICSNSRIFSAGKAEAPLTKNWTPEKSRARNSGSFINSRKMVGTFTIVVGL